MEYPFNLIIIVVPINTLVMRLCVPWLQSQGMDLLALRDTPHPLSILLPLGVGWGMERLENGNIS